MIIDALMICGISVVTTLITEGTSWYFIYRKPAYVQMKSQIEKTYEEIEKLKRDGKDFKKCQRLEKEMKRDNTLLAGMKLYSMIFLSIIMYVVYQMLRNYYKGVIVAKLPFVPFSLLTKMTHAGLETTDMTDCSMGCIYALCTIAIRSNILKIIGNEAPRGSGSFMDQFKALEANKDD